MSDSSEATTDTIGDDAVAGVTELCQDLLRIDTSNYGDGSGPGERAAAEHVMGLLTEVGLQPELVESEATRATVVVRVEGDPEGTRDRGALLVHGHLDVVPADAADWRVDPFAGEVQDGSLWGRGAVDMKDMDAMMLAVLRDLARTGRRPPRDLVFAFFADEEAGGVLGSHWLVQNRRDLLDGVTEAISEVGGYSVTVDGKDGDPVRLYLLQTAEKGITWLRLVANGRAGHGSQIATDNAVTRLGAAVGRIGAHEWPLEITPTVREFLGGVTEITGVELDPNDPSELLGRLGTVARFVGATLRDTANPTMLKAGYKHNVIPQTAEAFVDCRFLPGHEESLLATVRELAGEHVDVHVHHRDTSLETSFDGRLVDRMVAAIQAEDPGAPVLPYCLSGGTDNKALSTIGIRGFGFAPLQLPAELDFPAMFHGVDERVPIDALAFGTRVLDRLLRTC
ncbi:M20/M25/M40 family metallo-hydrolase [Angustibacter sp. McL0619]|uniref:M20/M25/M40 family metallo-hydrolase n=1 Tax=Angustibacter sp. McL0619 TaxID=3415676 RepID=UPI003CF5C353